jgi:hypothetical protein
MNSAQLRMMQRRLAQVKQSPTTPIVDQTSEAAPIGPYAGHKSGKRRRGVSVLKRRPRTSPVVTRYIARDEHGNTVATFDTLRYTRPE